MCIKTRYAAKERPGVGKRKLEGEEKIVMRMCGYLFNLHLPICL